jgi:hypothetical protein
MEIQKGKEPVLKGYLTIGYHEYIYKYHASARIGFRVVMTIKNEEQ